MNTVPFLAATTLAWANFATVHARAETTLEPDPPFRFYSVEDGLNQTLSLTVAQDGDGFLWIGSFGGLNRFDGKTFESLTTRHGLRENFVQELYVDSMDRLWAGDSSGGMTLLEQGKVVMTLDPPEDLRGTVREIHEHDGWLYMGIEPTGLTRLSLSQPALGIETVSKLGGEIDHIVTLNDDEMLLLGAGGLFRFAPGQDEELRKLEHEVTALAGNPEQGIFVGNEAGRVGAWINDDIVWGEDDYGAPIWRLFMSETGLAWVTAQKFVTPFGKPDESIPYDRAVDMLVDRDGITWLTSGQGLGRYLGERFDHFSLAQNNRTPDVSSIVADGQGGYWFGSDLGLQYVDSSGQLLDMNRLVPGDVRELRGVKLDRKRQLLWIAQIDGFVWRIDLASMTSTRVFPAENAAVMGLELDAYGHVWAGTYAGMLYSHNVDTGVTREFDLTHGGAIYSPAAGPDQWLWFPVNHMGIFRIDASREDSAPELVIPVEDIGRTLFAHTLVTSNSDGEQTVWFTTTEGGVFRYRKDRLNQLLIGSALSDQTIYSIYPIDADKIVLSTNRGAYHYDEQLDLLQRFGPLDGFVGIEGNAHSVLRDGDRHLWLGTAKGAARMDVSLPVVPPNPPRATITRVLVDGESANVDGSAGTQISGDKLLVEFAAVSTRRPDDVEYSYRLGRDAGGWSTPTSNHSIDFSSISSGNYELQIRARHAGQDWGPTDSWAFSVPAPFWKMPWFIALMTALGLIITRGVIHLRLRAVDRANRRLRWEVDERTRSIEQARRELEQTNNQLSTEIAERERSDALRADVEARFHQAYQNSPIGMALVDLDGLVYDANPTMKSLFWPQSKPEDREPLLDVILDEDRQRFTDFLFRFAAGDTVEPRIEVSCMASDGSSRRIDFFPSAVRNADNELQYIVLLANDVTESRAMTQQLEYHASFDELTGLLNRRAYHQRLQIVTQTPRAKGKAYLMFLDLDQFKVVNDTCGHGAGDELLRKVADIISSCVREDDTVARLGGDEFALILSGCSEEVALRCADRVRQSVQDFEFYWESDVFRVGVSIGVVPIDDATIDVDELQQIADAACYAAKEAGRNRVHLVKNESDTVHEQRGEMRWVQRLNHAIDTDSFVLFGQRLRAMDPATDPHERIEVLLRLNDRVAGRLIPPGAFLPAAERYGLQDKLDLWVVNRVIDVLTSQDKAALANRRFWVNLSGASMSDPNFSRALIDRVANSDVPRGSLNFEITETAVIRKMDDAATLVEALREMGCKIALDDFGSGLSSFGVLKRLKLDFVKIDGEFIRDIITDPTDRIFVKSIIDIAHTLNMRVVAEFVEDDDILAMVRDLGADYAQGFGVHRPEPLDQLAPAQDVRLQSGA